MWGFVAAHSRGVLTTLKRDGRPQLSVVDYCFDPVTGLLRSSVTDGRAKVANLRRDPRASLCVLAPDLGAYVVAEGTATFSAVAAHPDDAAADELVEVYRAIRGDHPDWPEYRAAMVTDHRLVLRLTLTRTYGHAT
ncbi:PPOX class F420-dependent enzyme [Pilimelia anulata]|uniref:PPOX class F420-dependent enzyme n=1 Tax=Pilimelia anulata TaxID=53371 RepID=A0A8J3F9L9_9ACTN|nr:PPOX class F420-dependent oxidoreductase [Pilimelia anulata]GGJ93382.1 PPOX class F420-dependent enzyme [Pilimelia anulata]